MRRLFLCAVPLALFSSYAAAVEVEVLQTKLDHPWSLAFYPTIAVCSLRSKAASFDFGSLERGFPTR